MKEKEAKYAFNVISDVSSFGMTDGKGRPSKPTQPNQQKYPGWLAGHPFRRTSVFDKAQEGISDDRGMTLVELLVAVGITAIIMGISIGIFISQYKSYRGSHAAKSAQTDNQKALDLIREDIALAGWGVQPQMAFFFLDGGANQPDQIYTNDTRLIAVDPNNAAATTSNLLPMVDSNCGACRRYSGTTLLSGTLDIDGDGASDLKSGTPVLLWTGSNATIRSINGSAGGLSAAVPANSQGSPAIHYCVDDGNSTHNCYQALDTQHLSLLREGRDSNGTLQPLAEDVVDLQVAYTDDGNNTFGGLGCAGSGTASGNCQMSPFDPSKIRRVELSVVTRSRDRIRAIADASSCRPAVANHLGSTATADCGYEYRTYTARITPFNSIR